MTLVFDILEKARHGDSKKISGALAGLAQWIECWPASQRVTGSIPSQGAHLGYRPDSHLGPCERQPIDVSLTH